MLCGKTEVYQAKGPHLSSKRETKRFKLVYLQCCQLVAIREHRCGYVSQFVARQIPGRTIRSYLKSIVSGVCVFEINIKSRLTTRKHSIECRRAVGGSTSGSSCPPAVCIWLRLSQGKISGCTVERKRTGSFPFRRLLLVTSAL